jgi:Fic family protein
MKLMTISWQPIENLPPNWHELKHDSLHALANVWKEQRVRLENTSSYKLFMEKIRRKIAIETGVIERLYTIDRGITRILVEKGITAELIPHGKTDKSANEIVAIIRDHEAAVERVFDYIGNQRQLSTSFIKQLHQLLTRNQEYTDAVDQFGNLGKVELLKGEWKRLPNNPVRKDGTVHYYTPPEQVGSQMDQLVEWHLQHTAEGVAPEVEAAWLHHRFTQIHPFQDGNGRVARNLATLVFLRDGWFPLVVLDENQDENEARSHYIDALEAADQGNLKPLVDLFANAQRQAFVASLSLSEEAIAETTSYQVVLNSVIEKIKNKQATRLEEATVIVQRYADKLYEIASTRLQDVRRDIEVALRGITGEYMVNVYSADANNERAGYYTFQIIRTAQLLGYYANLSGYKSWVRLKILLEDVQTTILLSFHPLGRNPQGVMICSACAYRRLSADEDDNGAIQNIEPLSQTPFEFTYQEDERALEERYNKWLNEILAIGIAYWQKSL